MNMTVVADQRLQRAVAGNLRFTRVNEWGDPDSTPATVTVAATRYGGTPVTVGTVTADPDLDGGYLAPITATATATLDLLSAVWTVDSVPTATTVVEIVGGYYFGVVDLRLSADTLNRTGANGYTDAALAYYRDCAEREAEFICDRAFVPRFTTVTLSGGDDWQLFTPHADLRTVRSVTVDGTVFAAGDLAALKIRGGAWIERVWGDPWPAGQENITIAYEHGLDRPPPEIRQAVLTRAREIALAAGPSGSGLPARAKTITTDGTTVSLDQAARTRTGNPEVDAVYDRWSRRPAASGSGANGGGPAPAGRSVDLNPGFDSLFHGGYR